MTDRDIGALVADLLLLAAVAYCLVCIPARAAITIDSGFPVCATQTNATGGTITTASWSTAGTNRVMVIAATCASGFATVYPLSISGGGLTWTSQKEEVLAGTFANQQGATVWTAVAASQLTTQTATLTRQHSANQGSCIVCVYALAGADTSTIVGGTGGRLDSSGSTNQLIDAPVTATAAGSYIIGAFTEGNDSNGLSANANSTFATTVTDSATAASLSVGRSTNTTSGSGSISIGASQSDLYATTAAIEILVSGGGGGGGGTNNWWGPSWSLRELLHLPHVIAWVGP